MGSVSRGWVGGVPNILEHLVWGFVIGFLKVPEKRTAFKGLIF